MCIEKIPVQHVENKLIEEFLWLKITSRLLNFNIWVFYMFGQNTEKCEFIHLFMLYSVEDLLIVYSALYNVLYKWTMSIYNHKNYMTENMYLCMDLFIYRMEKNKRSDRIIERIFNRLDFFCILITGKVSKMFKPKFLFQLSS